MFDRRALIIDDDVAIRILITRILERAFFDTDVARDGAEAIELLKTGNYAVVLLDLMMPRIDGAGVIRFLREHSPEKINSVIVITAFGSSIAADVTSTVARVIEKPFDVDKLLQEVTETCWLTAADAPERVASSE